MLLEQNSIRPRLAVVFLLISLPWVIAYIISAWHASLSLLYGHGSVYTAISAGIMSLPWGLLIPVRITNPYANSLFIMLAATINALIYCYGIWKIHLIIRGRERE